MKKLYKVDFFSPHDSGRLLDSVYVEAEYEEDAYERAGQMFLETLRDTSDVEEIKEDEEEDE